jgi:predicted DNA repair protein MutK
MRVYLNYQGHEKLQEQKLNQGHNKEKNHKKCKPKSNPRLETQNVKQEHDI